MKKVIIILFLLFNLYCLSNVSSIAEGKEEVHPLDILNHFDSQSFVSLTDIDITNSELNEIKEYFEKENIINLNNTKKQNHENLYRWIKNNISYNLSSNRPYDVFINRSGVCEGFSQLYKVLCYLCDISNVIVNGKMNGIGHAWNYIYLDKWYEIDITNSIYDDIFKNDISHYEDEYLTPYLYKDNDFIYYYSNGLAIKPINSNNKLKESINGLEITSLGQYLPHLLNNYQNDNIKSLEISLNITNVSKSYFDSFPNLELLLGNNCINGIYDDNNLFYIPKNIKKIIINKEVITKEMINNLPNLEEIVFLDNVKRVDSDAIIMCNNLRKVTFGVNIEEINVILNDCIIYGKSDIAKEYAENNNLEYLDLLDNNSVNDNIKISLLIMILIMAIFISSLVVINSYIKKRNNNK